MNADEFIASINRQVLQHLSKADRDFLRLNIEGRIENFD